MAAPHRWDCHYDTRGEGMVTGYSETDGRHKNDGVFRP